MWISQQLFCRCDTNFSPASREYPPPMPMWTAPTARRTVSLLDDLDEFDVRYMESYIEVTATSCSAGTLLSRLSLPFTGTETEEGDETGSNSTGTSAASAPAAAVASSTSDECPGEDPVHVQGAGLVGSGLFVPRAPPPPLLSSQLLDELNRIYFADLGLRAARPTCRRRSLALLVAAPKRRGEVSKPVTHVGNPFYKKKSFSRK